MYVLILSVRAEEIECVGDAALNLDRCAPNYEVIPEFPCYTRTIPATRIESQWKTPEECSAQCDANENCEMYAIHFRDERADKIGHCILFSYADVASEMPVQEAGSSHLKCVKNENGNGYVIEASGKAFPGSLGFYFQIVSDAEVCSSYCGSQGSSFFQWQISNNNCGCAQADTTMSDAVDNSDFNIYRIIDIIGSAFAKIGDGSCADANGNTLYNYCQFVDPWGGFAAGASGGALNCVKRLDQFTLSYQVIGMYYLDIDDPAETHCYYYFENAEDVPNSFITDNGNGREVMYCTDGSQLPTRAPLGAISQTVGGSDGECFVRMTSSLNDDCAASLPNLKNLETTHPYAGGDGRGSQIIDGTSYFCSPGTHQGLNGYGHACNLCTTDGFGAKGNAHGGSCADKPGIRSYIGAMYCRECNDGMESIVLENGGRICVTPQFAAEPTTLLPSSTPTECPTPEVGDFGGDLITYNTSTVLPNGRIHLDFIYSSAVITDFDITMDKPGFDYSSEDANGWTEDLEMCWSSINREFTYNQMSKAMDFEVYATQVLFAVDTSYEYSKHKSVTIGGQVHEWMETHTRSKHIPFEFTLPEKSVITTAFSGKNSPFIINTRAPTTSMPTFMPTTLIPTVMPSNEPTSSEPTNAPIASQPTIGPITSTPTTIPSASPITEPTQAPVTSRPTSTPFEPTVTPTTSGPTAKPSSSPTATNPSMAPSTSEPTLTPTLSPSFSPTFEPTMMPSYSPTDFPSLEPSANPLPTSDVITTIVPYISTETAQKGQNPLMEVQFTTIVNMPWKLIEPQANGSAITNLLSFQPTQQDTCDNFADLEQEFLKQSILYCQRWVLRFEGDRHCNNQPRALHIDFISEADNGQRSPTTLSWDLDLGSSPAFECAHDLGTFQVSVQVEGHNDANGDFTSPSKAYLDEFYYFRFTGSSGAPVTSLSVTNLDVQNAETSEFICQACQLKQELKWSLKDMDVDNYITALELDSSVFAGLRFVTFDFTIEVEMSADTGRRRLAETGEKLHQKVTLSLDSSTRQGGPRTDPPTVYTSSTSKAPTPFATTKSPVATADDGTVEQNDDIMETEVDASESASESAQIPVWIFIAIGAVASAIIAAVAYRFITQSNDKDIQFKDAVTPSGVGSSYNPALKIDVKA